MVSLYTDKAREERYFRLRKRKKRSELIFGISLAASALFCLTEMAAELFSGPLLKGVSGGLTSQALSMPGLHTIFTAASMILAIVAVCRKSWILAAMDIPLVLICGVIGLYCPLMIGMYNLPVLAASVYAGRIWEKLKEQEGFPRFRIDFEEYKHHEEAQSQYIERRAVESGVREEQDLLDPNAEMDELFDDGVLQRVGARLQKYHDRSLGGDAVIHPAEQPNGVMDELEEF